MTENRDFEVKAGPISDPNRLPPPRAIDCIKVDKVYEECKFVDVNEIDINCTTQQSNSNNNQVECSNVEIINKSCTIVSDTKVRLELKYKVTYEVNGVEETHVEDFETIVTLSRAGEEGLEPQCEVYLECLDAFFVNENTIRLCIGKLILFKLIAHVQLLVPVYGFCPQPEECRVAGECPDFSPIWPPYPEQD